MRPREPIADFGSAVARELSFDPRLARRVRAEVEDHLHEALADRADPHGEKRLAEVMCAFGDPQAFARQFLATALLSLARRAPVRFYPTFGREIGFCIKLNAAVALALIGAMATELVLTGVRLFEAELDARALVPFVSLMLEVAVAGGSMSYILIMMSRCSHALRLAP